MPRAPAADLTSLSDDELYMRVAQKETAAFHELVDRHLERQLRYAAKMLGNFQEAEDVVQEAFLKVWANAGRWSKGKAQFTTWLYRVVTNLCIDIHRKPNFVAWEAAPRMEDKSPLPDARIMEKEKAVLMRRALNGLTPRQRAAVILCYFQGLSNRDAAKVLNVHIKALESLLVRARQSLREALNSYESTFNGNT